ncbi:MAG: hypothetical protein M3Q46_04775 [Verrucomicrobiota bacterium]|nr:hypothetical protein [Verrucomicrobiota bacterium]
MAQKKKEQLFLSLRQSGYVLVLGSSLPEKQKDEAVENYLRRVAGSFHASDRPVPTPTPPTTGSR